VGKKIFLEGFLGVFLFFWVVFWVGFFIANPDQIRGPNPDPLFLLPVLTRTVVDFFSNDEIQKF
jgi:hypothetical protein